MAEGFVTCANPACDFRFEGFPGEVCSAECDAALAATPTEEN